MRLPIEAVTHAQDAYPEESGGFLVEVEGEVRYVPLTNAAANPRREFRILPHERAAAYRTGRVVGFVHSHPDDTAEPSRADLLAHNDSGLWDFIISVRQGRADDVVRLPPAEASRIALQGREFEHGRQDCYSLVRDYYAGYEGIQLRDYPREDEWWLSGKNYYRELLPLEGFTEITREQLRPGDLILMRIRSPVENHSAIWLGDGVIIHHLYGQKSRTDEYRAAYVRNTASFWRHAKKGDPHWTTWQQVW